MFFKKKKQGISTDNPWLNIPHPHNWLPANGGKELVCGECSVRKES